MRPIPLCIFHDMFGKKKNISFLFIFQDHIEVLKHMRTIYNQMTCQLMNAFRFHLLYNCFE